MTLIIYPQMFYMLILHLLLFPSKNWAHREYLNLKSIGSKRTFYFRSSGSQTWLRCWSQTNSITASIIGLINCLHTKSFLVTVSESSRNTPNLQNQTLILCLWLSFQFHKTTHYSLCSTQTLTGINIMAQVFANVCFWDVFVLLWMQCFVLQEMRGILHFVFNSWICVKFWKAAFVSSWKKLGLSQSGSFVKELTPTLPSK